MLGDESGEELAQHLTYLFAEQASSASAQQRASVRRWQGKDRFYQEVQRAAAQDPDASALAMDVVDDLVALAMPLPEAVEVWRGVRSVDNTFGVSIAQLSGSVGVESEAERFVATSTSRQVVEREFTEPATSPALLRVIAQKGTPAVWIPALGHPKSAGQRELLFMPTARVRILDVDLAGELPIVDVSLWG
jgi:hypothetical protein